MIIMQKHKGTRNLIKLVFVVGIIFVFASACSVGGFQQYSTASTSVIVNTVTSVPTETATPSPTENPYAIDVEKFHTFPESYEYLIAHLDEFVQAPDPLTERTAFDNWFIEQLIPVLGPESDRLVNIDAGYVAGGNTHYGASNIGEEYIGPIQFFYFENGGTIFPVPCFHAVKAGFPGMTLCIALFDSPSLVYGTNALEMVYSKSHNIRSMHIYYDVEMYRPDLAWGEMAEKVRAIGGYIPDLPDDHHVMFGFGEIRFKEPNN